MRKSLPLLDSIALWRKKVSRTPALLLLRVFVLIAFTQFLFNGELQAQSQIYFTAFSNPPASPATQTSSNLTYSTSTLSGWTGYTAAAYPAYGYTTSSAGTVTLNFASALTLNSNGTDRGKIIIHWGATANRPLNIALNGGSNVQIDNISTSADRNVVRTVSYDIPNATTSISSIKFVSSGGSGVYFFDVEVQTYPGGTPPIVTTTTATSITATSASSGGNVTAEGTGSVTARGVVWGTAAAPTVALTTKTNDGSGLGVFTSSLTSLAGNTKYYYRAYATSSVSTAYGSENNFVTYPNVPTATAANNISLTGFNANWTAPIQGTESFTYTLEYSTDNTFTTGVTTVSAINSTNTSYTASSLTSGATYYYRVKSVNATGASAVSNVITVVLVDGTQLTDYFRTVGSGSWTSSSSWESSHNNSTWVAANATPDNNASGITIKAGHTISASSNVTAAALTVEASATLEINSGITFTVANGSGTDITINGTVKNSGTFTLSGSTMVVNATGVYEDAQAATTATITLPTATWNAGSTCKLTGLVGTAGTNPTDYNSLQGVNQSFSNFIVDVPNLIGKLVLARNGATLFSVTGTLTVNSTGTSTYGMQLTSSSNQDNITIGNYVQNGGLVSIIHNSSNGVAKSLNVTGAFTLNGTSVFNISAYTTGTGVSTLNIGGNLSVASTATLQRNTTFGTGGATNLTFNGSASQTASFGITNGAINYTINNAANVTIGTDMTVNGALTFTSGKIVSGLNKVIISSTGSIVNGGTNGWVAGNLQKNVATGATVRTFEIGDASDYRPVTVSFGNVGTAGELTAAVSQVAGEHPNVASSNINTAKSVNRYWTFTNSGVVFDQYGAVFNFVAADVDAGANTANFAIKKYDGSWTTPTTGAKTATSTEATGMTAFSSFAIGEVNPFPVTITKFTGGRMGDVNRLNWTTIAESNNAGFVLERSADGEKYSEIAFVLPKSENGNSNSQINYVFDDLKPLRGNNYYRLKQIDKDGKYQYSTVLLLRSKATEITISSVYPNPSKDELKLVITSPTIDKVVLIITDISGRIQMQKVMQLTQGDNQNTLNLQSLTSGTYFIKLLGSIGAETAVSRFIKQ